MPKIKFNWRRALEIFIAEFLGTGMLVLVGCAGAVFSHQLVVIATNFGFAIGFIIAYEMAKFSWRRAFEIFLAEFFGTATLLLVGCGGIAYGLMNNFAITPLMLAAINFGMAIAFTLSTFGCISQSHINPIMTVVTVVLGFIPIIYYPVYFAGQVLGGIFGMGLLRAVGVEATISFILCLLFCSVLDDRNKALHESIPIKFAITIASLAMSFGHYTGASMNPARSFGPAVVNNFWKDQWVYWVGPYAGSILASVFWRFVFFVKPPPPEPVEKD